jgi:hypothetical protein
MNTLTTDEQRQCNKLALESIRQMEDWLLSDENTGVVGFVCCLWTLNQATQKSIPKMFGAGAVGHLEFAGKLLAQAENAHVMAWTDIAVRLQKLEGKP